MVREPGKIPNEPSNSDLMYQLGKIQAMQESAIRDQQDASEGRRRLHEKVDETNSVVQTIASQLNENSFQLRATTEIATQTKTDLSVFRAKYEKEAAPVLEGIATFRAEVDPLIRATKTVRNWAAFFAFLAGTGIVSMGAVVAFFNEAVKAWFRAWLGI